MRRDQALAKLPQLAAQIAAYGKVAEKAKRNEDMTAWDDAQRTIRRLQRERTNIIQRHH